MIDVTEESADDNRFHYALDRHPQGAQSTAAVRTQVPSITACVGASKGEAMAEA